jgi:molybdopterin adenylyltransferase
MSHTPPRQARVYVITVSDSRREEDDESGRLCRELVAAAGHQVTGHGILPDDPGVVATSCQELVAGGSVDAILLTGGTGISSRDSTYEAVAGLLDKRLDGFGELFRALSFAEVGTRAMASRAVAGTCGRALVFAMPGSPKAVRLAVERLIGPELGHLVGELHR